MPTRYLPEYARTSAAVSGRGAESDSPRVARSLELLTDELSALAARLPGDRRRLAYHVAGRPVSTLTQSQPKEI